MQATKRQFGDMSVLEAVYDPDYDAAVEDLPQTVLRLIQESGSTKVILDLRNQHLSRVVLRNLVVSIVVLKQRGIAVRLTGIEQTNRLELLRPKTIGLWKMTAVHTCTTAEEAFEDLTRM